MADPKSQTKSRRPQTLGHAQATTIRDRRSCGRIQVARLRRALAGLPLPTCDDGRIRLGADVSPWLRPEAATSAKGCSAMSTAGARARRR